MMAQIRPLEPRYLVPPLLECLQHSADPAPPTALLHLITPILQQRFNLSSWQSSSWVVLLNWNRDLAQKLPEAVQRADLELEYRGTDRVLYRRMDAETMLARVEAKDFDLLLTYLLCMVDEKNPSQGTWKLQELRCLEDEDEMSKWSDSLLEAEMVFRSSTTARTNGTNRTVMPYDNSAGHIDDEDDSSYWASYDMTPGQSRGRTPAKMSPAPPFLHGGIPNRVPSRPNNEADYFDRYMDVQPALDPYDPQEDGTGAAKSSTKQNGRQMVSLDIPAANYQNHVNGTSFDDEIEVEKENDGHTLSLRQPRPASSSSSHAQASPRSVAKLEEVAENQAHAEMGIKQHISTDIKSLYRLAKSAGISREEFVRIVNRELEVLPLLDLE